MRHGLTLVPCGLVIERIDPDGDALVIVARPSVRSASCPACGVLSSRIHSKYQRRLADLPSQGRLVRIRLWCRRFRCVTAGCCRKIFTERLTATGARPFARRTMRLDAIVHHLGLTLGGRPGQGFARRLLLPVSNDTLLRTVRRRAPNLTTSPKVIGIDAWAFRRGHRYGTIVCDLERRRIIDLLPDRGAATVTSWLKNHPGIEVIARDRGAAYIQAATEGRPDAVQVADRWHLMENASAAFLTAVQ
jgi:transposase